MCNEGIEKKETKNLFAILLSSVEGNKHFLFKIKIVRCRLSWSLLEIIARINVKKNFFLSIINTNDVNNII